jgi:hypothetical protein
MLEKLIDKFEMLFGESVIEVRFEALVDRFGLEAVDEALTYLTITGLRPAKADENPYGLLYVLCKKNEKYIKETW